MKKNGRHGCSQVAILAGIGLAVVCSCLEGLCHILDIYPRGVGAGEALNHPIADEGRGVGMSYLGSSSKYELNPSETQGADLADSIFLGGGGAFPDTPTHSWMAVKSPGYQVLQQALNLPDGGALRGLLVEADHRRVPRESQASTYPAVQIRILFHIEVEP